MKIGAAILAGTLLCGAVPLVGQAGPTVHVAVGFGVDTSSAPNEEIFDRWSEYLRSRPSCANPSPSWSEAERASSGDLLCSQVYMGFTMFTVVNLEPAAGMDSTYLIRTLVGATGDSGTAYRPLALYRTYAVREHGRWVLANALPRETRSWRHEHIGRITFVFPASYPFARPRAEGSARFVDSLAGAWSLDPPAAIGYYFTANPKDTQRAMGLDFIPAPDTAWGLADTQHKIVYVGSSASGEDYRHELSHLVLVPFTSVHHPGRLVNEGLATWTGGSAGLRFRQLMPGLSRYLEDHPQLTLAQIMADSPQREGSLDVGYDGFAVLCEMVYRQSGLAGITALADAGRDDKAVLDAAARAIEVPRDNLDTAWRARIHALALAP
ncbi:MAG TPA: hypothetical protein VH163_11615 [Gemmatimonadales bacterium]|nr:hypothetical protein [Gemmatimonadales bacterium]